MFVCKHIRLCKKCINANGLFHILSRMHESLHIIRLYYKLYFISALTTQFFSRSENKSQELRIVRP